MYTYRYILIYTAECPIRFNKNLVGFLCFFLLIGQRNCEWEKKQRVIRWQWKHSNSNVFNDSLFVVGQFSLKNLNYPDNKSDWKGKLKFGLSERTPLS